MDHDCKTLAELSKMTGIAGWVLQKEILANSGEVHWVNHDSISGLLFPSQRDLVGTLEEYLGPDKIHQMRQYQGVMIMQYGEWNGGPEKRVFVNWYPLKPKQPSAAESPQQ